MIEPLRGNALHLLSSAPIKYMVVRYDQSGIDEKS